MDTEVPLRKSFIKAIFFFNGISDLETGEREQTQPRLQKKQLKARKGANKGRHAKPYPAIHEAPTPRLALQRADKPASRKWKGKKLATNTPFSSKLGAEEPMEIWLNGGVALEYISDDDHDLIENEARSVTDAESSSLVCTSRDEDPITATNEEAIHTRDAFFSDTTTTTAENGDLVTSDPLHTLNTLCSNFVRSKTEIEMCNDIGPFFTDFDSRDDSLSEQDSRLEIDLSDEQQQPQPAEQQKAKEKSKGEKQGVWNINPFANETKMAASGLSVQQPGQSTKTPDNARKVNQTAQETRMAARLGTQQPEQNPGYARNVDQPAHETKMADRLCAQQPEERGETPVQHAHETKMAADRLCTQQPKESAETPVRHAHETKMAADRLCTQQPEENAEIPGVGLNQEVVKLVIEDHDKHLERLEPTVQLHLGKRGRVSFTVAEIRIALFMAKLYEENQRKFSNR
ncbi:hypothetical protein ACOMHN_010428 [Nucella lapillus]